MLACGETPNSMQRFVKPGGMDTSTRTASPDLSLRDHISASQVLQKKRQRTNFTHTHRHYTPKWSLIRSKLTTSATTHTNIRHTHTHPQSSDNTQTKNQTTHRHAHNFVAKLAVSFISKCVPPEGPASWICQDSHCLLQGIRIWSERKIGLQCLGCSRSSCGKGG